MWHNALNDHSSIVSISLFYQVPTPSETRNLNLPNFVAEVMMIVMMAAMVREVVVVQFSAIRSTPRPNGEGRDH